MHDDHVAVQDRVLMFNAVEVNGQLRGVGNYVKDKSDNADVCMMTKYSVNVVFQLPP